MALQLMDGVQNKPIQSLYDESSETMNDLYFIILI